MSDILSIEIFLVDSVALGHIIFIYLVYLIIVWKFVYLFFPLWGSLPCFCIPDNWTVSGTYGCSVKFCWMNILESPNCFFPSSYFSSPFHCLNDVLCIWFHLSLSSQFVIYYSDILLLIHFQWTCSCGEFTTGPTCWPIKWILYNFSLDGLLHLAHFLPLAQYCPVIHTSWDSRNVQCLCCSVGSNQLLVPVKHLKCGCVASGYCIGECSFRNCCFSYMALDLVSQSNCASPIGRSHLYSS